MKPGRFHTDSMPEQSAFASESQVLILGAFLMRGARCRRWRWFRSWDSCRARRQYVR